MSQHIAIVGGGQAGAALALQLRELGFGGKITIFGAESHPPYQRPPLSKKYLSGEWEAERLYLRPEATWHEMGINLRRSASVNAIDPATKSLMVGCERIFWDKLALTTGASPRPMPPLFAGRANVFDLRSLSDVDRLRDGFRDGARIAVVGGGFIGLETAAIAVKKGLDVTVIERAERILERAVGPETSRYFRDLHHQNGVRIREASAINDVGSTDGGCRLALQDGDVLDVELVLVGIGVLPATELAEAAGLTCNNGIVVDVHGRTSAPDVWAAGDCASFPLEGRNIRLESVQNAVDHAKSVAADMVGMGEAYQPVPWFWSDQYESKLQIAGLSQGYTGTVTRRGASGEAHWYFKDDRFIAVEAINDSRAFMTGKKLLLSGTELSQAALADVGFDPRSALG